MGECKIAPPIISKTPNPPAVTNAGDGAGNGLPYGFGYGHKIGLGSYRTEPDGRKAGARILLRDFLGDVIDTTPPVNAPVVSPLQRLS